MIPNRVGPLREWPSLVNLLAAPLRRFLAIQAASSILLLLATFAALAWANSQWRESYFAFWHQRVALEFGGLELALTLGHWVNDALMAIFFFVVGMEIKHELTLGELASRQRAMLPVFGAIGGMIAPALIYLAVQPGGPAAAGWGIPMATDIAFAVAALAVLGSRVPPVLKVFLLALAIVDDLGAVTVIAVFYTDEIRTGPLLLALLGLATVYAARLAGVRAYAPYFLMGALAWLATLASGVHATVAGVLLGLLTPVHPLSPGRTLIERAIERAREALVRIERGAPEKEHAPLLREIRALSRDAQSPLEVLTAALHPWVAFGVMPIFALANAGVTLDAGTLADPTGTRVALAVAVGLLVGKPLGIALFAIAGVRLGFATLPSNITVAALVGTGLLAGIGFTMALFITELAFGGSPLVSGAKLGVLGASLVACIAGLLALVRALPRAPEADAPD